MSGESAVNGDPLPPPIPGAEFKRLTRRQSILAWVLGAIAGIGIAVAALLIIAPDLI